MAKSEVNKSLSNKGVRLLIGIALLLLGTATIFATLKMTGNLFDPDHFPVWAYVSRCALLVASLIILWAAGIFIIGLSASAVVKNLVLSLFSLLSLMLMLEMVMMFVPVSSGGGKVLVSRNWMNMFWTENSLGYRDPEPDIVDRPSKPNILIVGDSYVAGHGLKRSEDRFSDILRQELGNCADVFNLGVCGANTKDEFGFLERFPVKPDLVILVHGKNDIQDVVTSDELERINGSTSDIQTRFPQRRFQSSFVFRNSFLFNFVEYLTYHLAVNRFEKNAIERFHSLNGLLKSDSGKRFYLSYYLNDSLFRRHLDDIDAVRELCERKQSKFMLLLFPATTDKLLNETEDMIDRPILQYASDKAIPAFSTASLLRSISEPHRVVNRFDPHPSVTTNKAVADTLYGLIPSVLNIDAACSQPVQTAD